MPEDRTPEDGAGELGPLGARLVGIGAGVSNESEDGGETLEEGLSEVTVPG